MGSADTEVSSEKDLSITVERVEKHRRGQNFEIQFLKHGALWDLTASVACGQTRVSFALS